MRRSTRRRWRSVRGSSRCSAGGLRPRRACVRGRSVERSSRLPALPHFAGHAVERFDQRPELVVADRLAIDAVVEVPGLDFPGGGRQALHGLGDALGEVQAHPGRAHENHERHHQEERQVDAGQRRAQHAKLAVVLVRVRDAAGARRRARRSESRWPPRRQPVRWSRPAVARPRPRESALRRSGSGSGVGGSICPAAACAGHAIGDRARVPARHVRRRDVDIGHRPRAACVPG